MIRKYYRVCNERKKLKVFGIVATIVGIAGSMLSNWVDEQKMDEKIEEKVDEAFAKREEEIEES